MRGKVLTEDTHASVSYYYFPFKYQAAAEGPSRAAFALTYVHLADLVIVIGPRFELQRGNVWGPALVGHDDKKGRSKPH